MRTWQVLQRYVMHHLVIAALQEGGVNRHKRRQPLAGKPRGKCDRMLLCNAHVVHALGEHLHPGWVDTLVKVYVVVGCWGVGQKCSMACKTRGQALHCSIEHG